MAKGICFPKNHTLIYICICGKVGSRKSPRQKYCEECRKYIYSLKHLDWCLEHRDKPLFYIEKSICSMCGIKFEWFKSKSSHNKRHYCNSCTKKRYRNATRRYRLKKKGMQPITSKEIKEIIKKRYDTNLNHEACSLYDAEKRNNLCLVVGDK